MDPDGGPGRDPAPRRASDSPAAPKGEVRAYALLTLAFVFMALNVVVGRAAHEDVPPLGLSFWRWTIAAILFLPFSFRRVREQFRLVLAHWRMLLFISIVMVPFGNNLIYVGLQDTTAINGGLIPVARPAMILVIVWLVFKGTVTRNQWVGIGIAAIGVLLVLMRGDPAVLAGLTFNKGDLWLVAASVGVACYQTSISRVPREIHPVVLLQVTMIIGAVLMLPGYLWETAAGRPVEPTWPAIGAILFVATLPSIGAVYLINTGIAAVGPARMGIFNYLQPLFVAMISVPLLGETLAWYHPIALALVAGGIVVSSRRKRAG